MKKIIVFILALIPWFASSLLLKENIAYYNSLNLPFFAPPSIVFPIVWTIIYILLAYNIYLIFTEYGFDKDARCYYLILLINFIFNQLFTFIFFCLKNNFLAFVDSLAVLITTLWLYYESDKLNNESSRYLIPYIIWGAFATILSLTIYLLNL